MSTTEPGGGAAAEVVEATRARLGGVGVWSELVKSAPIDDQRMPNWLAQVEGLDRHPFGRHFMGLAAVLDTRSQPRQVLFEGGWPVVLGPQQQADQVSGQGAPPSVDRHRPPQPASQRF